MEDEQPNFVPHWQCQECGYVDRRREKPVDRIVFYAKVAKGIIPKCPKCHSAAFMPVGY